MIDWVRQNPLEATVITVNLLANALANGLRMAWPVEPERPRAVGFFLGFVDPFALNFWGPFKR
jgi:hypothetical protein